MSEYAGFELYERDTGLEKERGVDIDFGPNASIRILRAGGSNAKYARAFARITKPHRRQMDAGTLDEELSKELHAEIYAEAIVIGWKGICQRETGEPIPFNKEEVIKFMLAVPEVFQIIKNSAESMDTFRQEEIEEEAQVLGNS